MANSSSSHASAELETKDAVPTQPREKEVSVVENVERGGKKTEEVGEGRQEAKMRTSGLGGENLTESSADKAPMRRHTVLATT